MEPVPAEHRLADLGPLFAGAGSTGTRGCRASGRAQVEPDGGQFGRGDMKLYPGRPVRDFGRPAQGHRLLRLLHEVGACCPDDGEKALDLDVDRVTVSLV